MRTTRSCGSAAFFAAAFVFALATVGLQPSAISDDKHPAKKPAITKDWTRITLDQDAIKAELAQITEKIVKKDIPKNIKKQGDDVAEYFNRAVIIEHKIRLDDLIKNPDLEEASVCSKKWFVAIYAEIADMYASIDKMDAAVTAENKENYIAALAEFEKKRLALKNTLANPIKLTKDQYEAVKAANEKRREKYAEQMKKAGK